MAGSENTTSQRGALRFPGGNRHLNYKTDFEDGEALLVNISTSGCAISEATAELYLDQKLLVTLSLDGPEKQLQIRAVVIRVQTQGIALRFLHLEENTKRQLIRFFARENRKQKHRPTSASF